jgi:hypothetical protein
MIEELGFFFGEEQIEGLYFHLWAKAQLAFSLLLPRP